MVLQFSQLLFWNAECWCGSSHRKANEGDVVCVCVLAFWVYLFAGIRELILHAIRKTRSAFAIFQATQKPNQTDFGAVEEYRPVGWRCYYKTTENQVYFAINNCTTEIIKKKQRLFSGSIPSPPLAISIHSSCKSFSFCCSNKTFGQSLIIGFGSRKWNEIVCDRVHECVYENTIQRLVWFVWFRCLVFELWADLPMNKQFEFMFNGLVKMNEAKEMASSNQSWLR